MQAKAYPDILSNVSTAAVSAGLADILSSQNLTGLVLLPSNQVRLAAVFRSWDCVHCYLPAFAPCFAAKVSQRGSTPTHMACGMQAFQDLLSSAQAASPNITLDQLLNPPKPQTLTEILLYHLAPEAACVHLNLSTGSDTLNASISTPLQGKNITIT
jgi:hypothetical protein